MLDSATIERLAARLELLLSMAGLSVGSMSAVSGFFGMNLISGLEEAKGVFMLVTGVSMLLTGSLFIGCLRQLRSLSKKQRGGLLDVQALKSVLANLDAVTLLLARSADVNAEALGRATAWSVADANVVPHVREHHTYLSSSSALKV